MAAGIASRREGTLIEWEPRAWDDETWHSMDRAAHEGHALTILIRPVPGDIERLVSWFRDHPRAAETAVVAVIECRPGDLERIVDPVRMLPKWPRTWIGPVEEPQEEKSPSGQPV